MAKKLKVLVGCEYSGTVRDAFIRGGADAMSCDLLPTESPGPHYQGSVLDILHDGWDLAIFHPPCTYLTTTGNKWFKPEFSKRFPDRHQKREDALDFVWKLLNAPIKRIALENPVSVISSRIRKPDQIIQPYHFGSTISKRTCLWLKNLMPLVRTKICDPEIVMIAGKPHSKMHIDTGRMPAEIRSKIRSKTPQGIADAMASQWLPRLQAEQIGLLEGV